MRISHPREDVVTLSQGQLGALRQALRETLEKEQIVRRGPLTKGKKSQRWARKWCLGNGQSCSSLVELRAKARQVLLICNPSTREAEARRIQVQGQPSACLKQSPCGFMLG